jgi:hypothetical protein
MASTLLELARSNHEDLEVGTNRIVKLLSTETKTHKQKLIQQVSPARARVLPAGRAASRLGAVRASSACVPRVLLWVSRRMCPAAVL